MSRRAISRYLIGVGLALATLSFAEMPRQSEFSGKRDAQIGVVPEQGLGFGVDSSGDGDNAGSSNFCDDGTGHCTLRAAIQVANAHPGVDFIGFVIPASDPGCDANGNCTINLPRSLPNISEGVSIGGPGPGKIIVRRSSTDSFGIFAVTTAGAVTLSGMTISNGSGLFGGGIVNENDGTVNITNAVLDGNDALLQGGAIDNAHNGTVNITNSTLSNNTCPAGAGIMSGRTGSDNGTVNITSSTFVGNNATAVSNNGHGRMNIIGSTFDGNLASSAAGIENNAGTVNITNCTISGNIATGSFGGGIVNYSGTTNVTNSTVIGNLASSGAGGGIHNDTGTVNVRSSIIALNAADTMGPDVFGFFATGGFNLIGTTDGSTGFDALTDQTGTVAAPLNPRLDPVGLRNNGGPTQTIALLFGSPAIDKGTSNSLTGQLTTEQRGTGFARTFDDPANGNAVGGDATDIGAFEVQTAAPTVLANISTRLRVETGDNVLIGGFIITGTQPKNVILRAIGPSLPLSGTLADPTLELHDSSNALLASNDNWRSDQQAEIIATTIAPANDFESAIVVTLPANNAGYTAIVRGANNGTGVGLIEAYDLDRGVNSKLGNISTRGLVQTGDNVLIAGTILLGSAPQRVLVRGIGPSLAGFGIAGAMQNPTLELRDQDGTLLRANDNWRSDQEQEIIATTIPPSNDLESALIHTLPASGASYTAILRGVNNTTGIAVVEVYPLN
jgi:hypothetical protein